MFEESGGEIHGRTDKRDRASRRRADDANCDLSDIEAEARLNDMPVARLQCGERRPHGQRRLGSVRYRREIEQGAVTFVIFDIAAMRDGNVGHQLGEPLNQQEHLRGWLLDHQPRGVSKIHEQHRKVSCDR